MVFVCEMIGVRYERLTGLQGYIRARQGKALDGMTIKPHPDN